MRCNNNYMKNWLVDNKIKDDDYENSQKEKNLPKFVFRWDYVINILY